jgi:cation transport ATPase
MADQNPNSVLFSLEELRRIEEERVAAEHQAEQNRVAAAEQAKLDEQRRLEAEEQARIQAEEARVKAEQEAREQADREERIRIAEAERRARVEAEMKLQQQKIAAEAEAAAKVKARKLRNTILAISGIAVIALSGLGFWLYKANEDRSMIHNLSASPSTALSAACLSAFSCHAGTYAEKAHRSTTMTHFFGYASGSKAPHSARSEVVNHAPSFSSS